jgi:hypothetical protein
MESHFTERVAGRGVAGIETNLSKRAINYLQPGGMADGPLLRRPIAIEPDAVADLKISLLYVHHHGAFLAATRRQHQREILEAQCW